MKPNTLGLLGLIARDIRRMNNRASKPLPGHDGSSFKQNRRRELKAAARRRQRRIHTHSRRTR